MTPQNLVMNTIPVMPVESLVLDPFAGRVAVAPGEVFVNMTGHGIREKLARLETALLAETGVDMPVEHHFSRGVYARELSIPKGTVLVGKIHKFSQINIISKGEISVLTDEGVKRIKAPFTLVSLPGVKRAGYAHEDTVWTTIHGTDETDLERLEEQLIAGSFEEYDNFCAALSQGE